jgi:hypothetical protein
MKNMISALLSVYVYSNTRCQNHVVADSQMIRLLNPANYNVHLQEKTSQNARLTWNFFDFEQAGVWAGD